MAGIWDAIVNFFQTEALSPHGICLLWRPELIWTHAVSDILIGLAYFSIPLAMGVFLYHRRDVRFGWAIWMFVGFIMMCGITHFMMVVTLWQPVYGVEALLKAITALVSVITAIALWPLLPRVIGLPSPATLQARIDERDLALAELRAAMATMVQLEEHQDRQKLLLDELNHRVKNTLTSVQSIAVQTLERSRGLEDFQATFVERLMALSATHNILVKHQWSGATLRELTDASLDHYGRPYSYVGPDLNLQPNVAVTLGLALHELATNAVKYGAWSAAGEVVLEVSTGSDGEVTLIWRERGGPPVQAPDETGFGSRLLQRGVAGDLGGSVTLDFRPEGLVCTIRTALSAKISPMVS